MTIKNKRLRFLDFGSAVMWSLAWVVVAIALATPAAALASGITAFMAFFAGRKLAALELRTSAVVVIAPLVAAVLLALSRWPSRSVLMAKLFPSPEALTLFTNFFVWGIFAFLLVFCLQFLSNRYQIFVSVEVLIVGLFLSTPFAAHRDGFINRPYFLVDILWSRDWDPVPVLQLIGVVIAISLILLTIGRATQRSSVVDLVVLSAIALGAYLYIPQNVIKDMVTDPPASSGLTGQPREGDEGGKPSNPGAPNQPMSGSTGEGGGSSNNDNPFPFEASDQKPKPQPVAVVVFRDDYDSPDGYYYFRQTAFSQYNGFRLVKDTTGQADLDLFRSFPSTTETIAAPPFRPDIPMRKLDTRVALMSSHTEPFGLVAPIQMKPAQNPNIEQFERAYDVLSQVYEGDYGEILASDLVSPAWSAETKAHYLAYPDKDLRYKKLAGEIVATVDPRYKSLPLAKAIAITLYLGEKGKYTTKKRLVNGSEDPTADFLFGDLTGYCVHFSHSAVYLMRAAGIPARVGAGYAVETRNRRGSALLILSSAAHAWPEVWLDGLGWYPLDVSPQTNLDAAEPPPDYDLQAMLAEMAQNDKELTEQPPEFDLRNYLKMVMGVIWSFMPWVLAAALIASYGLKIERRLAPWLEKGEKEKTDALYRAALDRLTEVGFRRRYGQGRLAFAEQNKVRLPSLMLLTKGHLARSFSDKGAPAKLESYELAELYKSYGKLGQDIAASVPRWRRLLGILNPLSWLLTK